MVWTQGLTFYLCIYQEQTCNNNLTQYLVCGECRCFFVFSHLNLPLLFINLNSLRNTYKIQWISQLNFVSICKYIQPIDVVLQKPLFADFDSELAFDDWFYNSFDLVLVCDFSGYSSNLSVLDSSFLDSLAQILCLLDFLRGYLCRDHFDHLVATILSELLFHFNSLSLSQDLLFCKLAELCCLDPSIEIIGAGMNSNCLGNEWILLDI